MQKGFPDPNSSCTWRKGELTSKCGLLQVFASWFMSQFFFFPFSFLSYPAVELKENQNSAVALALPSCCPVQGQRDIALSLWARRCERTRGNPPTDRERTLQTNHSTGARQLCRTTERRTPVQPCSPSQTADHSTRLLWCPTHTGRHSGGSPLLLTYCKASPWTSNCETENENSIKDERGKLCTVKSNDTDSFFPSFIQKIRKLEVSCKLNECLV